MTDARALANPARRARRRRHRLWREGGSSTAAWSVGLLGGAVTMLGVGVLAARAAAMLLPAGTGDDVARAVIWVSLAAPALVAVLRSRPRGLLRWRAIDLAYGLVFGVLVRGVQGMLESLGGTPPAWPSTFSSGRGLPAGFLADALAGTVITPVVEEFFFRAVVLVCLFVLVRPMSGAVAAAVAAVAVSTGLFVVAHVLTGSPDAVDLATLAVLALVTGAFVVGTGRLWAAVIVHVVFNASGFALVAVGTLLA